MTRAITLQALRRNCRVAAKFGGEIALLTFPAIARSIPS